jgi:hypothetical protein
VSTIYFYAGATSYSAAVNKKTPVAKCCRRQIRSDDRKDTVGAVGVVGAIAKQLPCTKLGI